MQARHALLLLASSCFRDHPSGAVEITGSDCYSCHQPDYEAALPVHPGNFPTTCADCHSTDAWRPALLGAHPEARFAIKTGPHAGIACRDCHNPALGTSAGGLNTDCIGCHTGYHAQARMASGHQGVAGYSWTNPGCRTCHRDGRAGHHPEQRFPIASGPHANIACADCHDRTISPVDSLNNTNCVSANCHPRSRYPSNEEHPAWQGDTNKHFCANSGCHPTGLRGGD